MRTVTSAIITIACAIVAIACAIVAIARTVSRCRLCCANYRVPCCRVYDVTDTDASVGIYDNIAWCWLTRLLLQCDPIRGCDVNHPKYPQIPELLRETS